MNDKKTSFDPILDDYAFFEQHSTEAESDLAGYAHSPHNPEANSKFSSSVSAEPSHLLG